MRPPSEAESRAMEPTDVISLRKDVGLHDAPLQRESSIGVIFVVVLVLVVSDALPCVRLHLLQTTHEHLLPCRAK